MTDPEDVIFFQDGIRDGEHLRFEMHSSFLEVVKRTEKRLVVASGTREERVQQVLGEIQQFKKDKIRFSS